MIPEQNENIRVLDESVERAINFLYIATLIASISINLFDIFRLIEMSEAFILYTNIPAIFIIFLSFLLKITNIISLKQSFLIVVITILANSIFSVFQSRYLEDLIISLLRESIFIAFLISLSAFVVSRWLAYSITAVFCLFIIILYLHTRDNYILENIPVLISIFIAYTFFINYLIYVIYSSLDQLKEKNKVIKEQLEEIKAQNEELSQFYEDLYVQRELLEEKNEQLNEKNLKLTLSQNELEKLNDTKNKLFSVIGHDIKNPMHVVLGYSKLLSDRFNKLKSEKKKHYIDIINGNIKNLFKLLENLLIWSKAQQDLLLFNPEDVDLNFMITEILELYKDLIEQKELEIDFSTEPDLYAFVDKNMIQIVLRNLIDNAIKYSNSEGVVTISGAKKDQFVLINISDNGIGIPEQMKNQIYDLYDNKKRPGTQGEKGTGFGLAICKEFIDKNNSKIWLESIEGQETTFSIKLPVNKSD